MTISQLYCFFATATSRRYIDVAERLHMNQSTLFKTLKSLETELSVELFVKESSGIVMTDAARALYPHMQYVLAQYEQMQTVASSYRKPGPAALNIGSMYFAKFYDLIHLTHEFEISCPTVKVTLNEHRASELNDLLRKRELSTAFIYKEFIQGNYSRVLDIARDPIVAVMNKRSAKQYTSPIDLSQLKNRRFILLQGDQMIHHFLQTACIHEGFVPNELPIDARVDTIYELVQGSDAVSLFMSSFTGNLSSDNDICILPLASSPALTLSLVCTDAVPSAEHMELEHFILRHLCPPFC